MSCGWLKVSIRLQLHQSGTPHLKSRPLSPYMEALPEMKLHWRKEIWLCIQPPYLVRSLTQPILQTISGNTTGAGIYISADNDHPIILRHCTIEGNVAIEGASLHNQAVTLIDSSSISNTVIEGASGGSILNTGIGAQLSLINTTITQECINCPEAITNRAGATLQIQEGVTIEKD